MPYKPSPSEPIAVVASSCRFAGGASSPSKLWDLLKEPTDLTRPVPPSRFNITAFHHPEGDYHGTTDAPNAYFLDDEHDPRAFDAGFFGIAPKEAEAVDPQQRLLLETVYEALESAGYKLPAWTGTDVAVYVGAMTSDFDAMSQRDDLTTSPYYATGNARSILANRISYFFDFHGPSATIDTACSSSLVALHHAVLSLRAGDCRAACVAGVNLMLAPEQFVVESSLHMLSPTGHCHMWDTRADGYARGEGAAVLLLKPLSRALADGDACRIQAIIRETGVGSDGRTSGITMPSPEAQAALIRSTYRRAGLDLADPADWCQYFEAHGTGTPVGDPREAQAIHSAFYGPGPVPAAPPAAAASRGNLLVGSVKTVIGHTEGAAGLAGVLKVMLAMKNAQVPPNLHMQQLSPAVAPFCTPSPAHTGHLEVASTLQRWPARPAGQPMRASVNSFGFGGTNAHAIIEHYDASIHATARECTAAAEANTATPAASLPPIPLVLSATSATSLRALAQQYLAHLQTLHDSGSPVSFPDVAWRVHASRTPFLQRLAIRATDRVAAVQALSRLLQSDSSNSSNSATAADDFGVRARRTDAPLKLVGIFTGQGAQWAGMSKHLLLTSRIYRDAIHSLDAVLQACPHPPAWRIATELQKMDADGARIQEAAISQPLCTALQVGLVTLLQHLGVQFACVVGHSSGEIGAAFAAGRITAGDAIRLAYYRGLSVSHPDMAHCRGAMLAVQLSYADAARFCEPFAGTLCVAASNAPRSTTLSGDADAVERAERQLAGDGLFARRLVVDRAYHSHHMARFADIYSGYLAACAVAPLAMDRSAETPLWISSVDPTGDAPTQEQLAGSYWVDNMVQPVLFREAVETALSRAGLQDGIDGAIEVGPHTTLKGPFLDTYAEARASSSATTATITTTADTPVYTSLLRRGQRDDLAFQDFMGLMATRFDPCPIQVEGLLGADEQRVWDASLARMHSSGGNDDNAAERLPAYVWDHTQLYYRQSRIVRQFHHQTAAPHELLGTRTRDDVDGCELRWRNLLRVDKLPWLAHHAFQGQPLLPASAYCIMALDAAKALLAGRPASRIEIEDIAFVGGIPLEREGPATEIMFSLVVQSRSRRDETIQASFGVYATPEASDMPMRERCSGRIRVVLGAPDKDALPHRTDPREQPETFAVPIDSFYAMMADVGLAYSGPFAAMESLQRRHDFASARLPRFHADDTTGLAISPATLDACLQSCFATFSSPGDQALWTAFLPIRMKRVAFSMAHKGVAGAAGPKRTRGSASAQAGGRYSVDAALTHFQEATPDAPTRITGDILVYNDDGDMEVMVEGLTVGALASSGPGADRELYLHTQYVADPEHTLAMGTATEEMDDDDDDDAVDDRVLDESCERVACFGHPASAWPLETKDTLEQHILASPYAMTLAKIRKLAPARALDQPHQCQYQAIMEEGRHARQFQRQVARIVRQIAHRYPRVSVLSLTDADACLSLPIARGLRAAFTSYTSATVGADRGLAHYLETQPARLAQRVHVVTLDDAQAIKDALAADAAVTQHAPLDLVVLSTAIFKQLASSDAVLAQIKKLMRPGGFLLLVHMPMAATGNSQNETAMEMTEDAGDDRSMCSASSDDDMVTPPDWPDRLEQSGFVAPAAANTDQHYPGGFSITVRQRRSPSQQPSNAKLPDSVLVIGGASAGTIALAAATRQCLSAHLDGDATVVHGLDELAGMAPSALASFTAVVVLADLDDHQPVLSTLDEQRLDALRRLLLVPDRAVLWVTQGARNGNAECAASYGFTRSVRAEMPSLTLQMLDFDDLQMVDGQLRAPSPSRAATKPLAAAVIADQFLQLLWAKAEKQSSKRRDADATPHLGSLETELFIGPDSVRLIPRMVPFASGNANFSASRRVVARPVNTLSTCIEVVRDADAQAPSTTAAYSYTTRIGPAITSRADAGQPDPDVSVIKVLYSTPDALYNGCCLCIGQDEQSGCIVAAMSASSASFVSVPRQHTVPLGQATAVFEASPGAYARFLAKMVLSQSICQSIGQSLDSSSPLVLAAPDALLLTCAQTTAMANEHTMVSIDVAARPTQMQGNTIHIHPQSTPSQISAALRRFGAGTALISFLPPDHAVAQHMRASLPAGCTVQSWQQVGQRHVSTDEAAYALLAMAVGTAGQHLGAITPTRAAPELVSLPSLLSGSAHPEAAPSIIDWRADRMAAHIERPLQGVRGRRHADAGSDVALRHNRTYALIGITRDMGQSLATLFVRQGARHVVLASRTPAARPPQWARHLRSVYGATVRFAALDVTDLAAVRQFRADVETSMPPVGGVVNGAMVLEDRVLAHMTAATFSRVMRPKTVGSRNLDTVFRDDGRDADRQLDFFIMTSSFAAPGGHAGQSNYAAANMYMNGLAASRQRRGVAGSVLNIGVIYGLGFLHREKAELYAGLEREGYPPISERDLHHMFLEAIRQGRPKTRAADRARPIVDLTTGLSRYDPDDAPERALHWHHDPRFSHFTVRGSDSSATAAAHGAAADHSSVQRLADMISDAAAPADAVGQQLVVALIERLATLLHLDGASAIRGDSSLAELGVDSLVAVETRTWLWRATGQDVAVMRILGAPSIYKSNKTVCMDIGQAVVARRDAQ